MQNKELGFNLIELMIVIAIMATLAAIASPSYSHYLNKGRAISAVVLTASLMLGLGMPALLMSLGTKAMTLTGVASLLFAVTFDPAQSPAGGPASGESCRMSASGSARIASSACWGGAANRFYSSR